MLDTRKSETENPVADAAAGEPNGPRLNGVVDVTRSNRVAGWAIDRADAKAAVEVDILVEGERVATVRADRHREDLEKNGIGTGNYGFSLEIDPPIDPGMAFSVAAIARASDGTQGKLRPIGKACAASDPERRLLERIFEEVIALRAAIAERGLPAAASDSEAAAERLRGMLDRIEVVQARIEAQGAAADPGSPRAGGSDAGLRTIATVALAVALGSLGIGLYSMWGF